ncbi:MAG: hypothetical protein ACLP5V_08295 [Candidatus Bathyarchaeia archaeon]
MKTEIKNLTERVERLNENQAASLTTDEGNMARGIWINLHWTREEADEYANIRKRRDVLHEKWLQGKTTPEENQESSRLSERSTYLAHDISMRRCLANDVMRDRVWPELVPRAIRFTKLTEKPEDTLPDAEMQELNDLTKWFMDLRVKVVESAEKQLKKPPQR